MMAENYEKRYQQVIERVRSGGGRDPQNLHNADVLT